MKHVECMKFSSKTLRVTRYALRDGERGVSLIEVVVMVFVATVLLFSIAEVAKLSFRTFSAKKFEYRAVLYLNEGIEALHAMRDESWTTKIAPITVSTTQYIVPTSNSWIFTASSPGQLDGVFTRTAVLQNIFRDTADDINPGGSTPDPDTKKATVTISWVSPVGPRSLSVDTYITNYLKN